MEKEISIADYNKIPDVLIFSAKANSHKIIMKTRKGRDFQEITYSEFIEKTKMVAGYLKSKGFKRQEKAAIIGENRPEWGISYFGILYAGGIVVPLDSRATPSEWAHTLEHSESKFVFVSGKFYKDIVALKQKLPELKEIISFDSENPQPNLQHIFLKAESSGEPEELKRDNIAIILYTSGTTGTPKGVMLTHGNILSNIEMMLKAFEINKDDNFFSVLPLHHVFEGTCGFLAPITVGASIFYASSLKSKELLEDLKAVRPTVFLVVPLLLEKFLLGINKNIKKFSIIKRMMFYLLKEISKFFLFIGNKKVCKILFKKLISQIGLDRLKYLVSGGAALPRWISKEYEIMGCSIYQGYGLSETSPVVSVNLPNKFKNESVGLPLPGVEIRMFNPDHDGVGEIGVKGPIVMKGYYKNEEDTKKAFVDGWFLTGDMGKIDKDGFLYITGRKKSVIITKGGQNIYPEEIEELLLKSPFIKEALVLARMHSKTKTEQIHAIVYPDFEFLEEKGIEINNMQLNELIKAEIEKVNKELADYKKIRGFSIRQKEFPKTTTQKIKRFLFEGY